MIKIVKGSDNIVVLTLEEKRTISPFRYAITFTNKETNTSVSCDITDTSSYTSRYNRFVITETTNPVAANSEIEVSEGQYEYTATCYRVGPGSPSSEVVETGIMQCYDDTNNTNTEYEASSTNTVYEG